jgi:hypothetical protein
MFMVAEMLPRGWRLQVTLFCLELFATLTG